MSILVGREAPDFTAPAISSTGEIITFSLHKMLSTDYGLLFFYPLDFTFVCPSELIALNKRLDEFKKLNVTIMAVSIDSHFTHLAWRNTPLNKGGIGPVNYTLISDITHNICKDYDVEYQGVALRAAFILDKKKIIRAQHIHDLPLGRSIDELLRVITALQFHEQCGEVCPAGWKPGHSGIQPTSSGIAKFLEQHAEDL